MGLLQPNKTKGKCLEKLIKAKFKIDVIAVREPRSAQQFKDRMIWERLRYILLKRYDYQ